MRPLEWGRDAVLHAEYARAMAAGTWDSAAGPGAHRIAFIAPLAVAYAAGFNEWSGAVVIAAFAVMLVAAGQAFATAMAGPRAGLVAGLVLALCPLTVLYSVPLMADVPAAAAAACVFWGATRFRANGSMRAVVAAALAAGVGFWIKETVLLAAAGVLAWLLWRRAWKPAAVFGLTVAAFAAPATGASTLAADTGAMIRAEGVDPGLSPLPFARAVLWPESPEFSLLGPTMWLFLACAFAQRRLAAWVVAAWLVLAVMPMSLDPPTRMFIPYPRYLSIALAPIAATIATALSRPRPAAVVLALYAAASLLTSDSRSALSRARTDATREAIRAAEARSPRVVHASEGFHGLAGLLGSKAQWRTLREFERGDGVVLLLHDRERDALSSKLDGWAVVWEREFTEPLPGRLRVESWLGGGVEPKRRRMYVLEPK